VKAALGFMGATLLVLVALVIQRGVASEAARAAGSQARQIAPALVIGIVMAGCLEALLPKAWIERWLSDAAGLRGILVAWIAGALTPSGSIVGLPLAAGSFRAGVGAPVLVTYLVSLSTLSALRLPIEIGFIGGRLAALRFAASLVLPPIAGVVTRGLVLLLRG
jgi:uncharacterized membrane protein YraQ (UPF0718 family)